MCIRDSEQVYEDGGDPSEFRQPLVLAGAETQGNHLGDELPESALRGGGDVRGIDRLNGNGGAKAMDADIACLGRPTVVSVVEERRHLRSDHDRARVRIRLETGETLDRGTDHRAVFPPACATNIENVERSAGDGDLDGHVSIIRACPVGYEILERERTLGRPQRLIVHATFDSPPDHEDGITGEVDDLSPVGDTRRE